MPISFSCSGCGKRDSVDEKFAGRKLKCKHCAQVITVPRTEEPAQQAGEHYGPRYDDLFDEPPAALMQPVQTASAASEDDPPPPRRMASKPAKAKRKKAKGASASRLPLLVKIGLTLIGGLLAFGGLGMLSIGITTGHPEARWMGIAMLATCVFAGMAAVCNLKLLFMGDACGYGRLPWYTPFRRLVWIMTNLSETGPLLLGNLIGLAGLVIVWALTIPYVKSIKVPKHVAAPPAWAVHGDVTKGFPGTLPRTMQPTVPPPLGPSR